MIGQVLGPYQVLSKLGAGGMGEVYRARDTKLKREVALKVLPEAFTRDPDRLARFKREAQVLASLNHPLIGAIYGFEDSSEIYALVLELVEGDTLADRIARGPIPLQRGRTDRASDLPGSRSRPRAGDRSSRSETREYQDHSRRRRQGARFRPCQARPPRSRGRSSGRHGIAHDHVARRDDRRWRPARHGRLHVARAGERADRRQAKRHLGVRLRALRNAHRPACF